MHQPLLAPYEVSPIRVEKLRQEVLTHPDQSFVTYVSDGLENGFRVGFNPLSVSLKSATQNMPSVSLQPSVIDDYLHTELAKFDVESTYRIIPVHPNDRYILGMQWQGNYFVDMALPFGLGSAPYIFSSVADLAEWFLKKQYDVCFLLHYLDDFRTLGPPNSQTCQRNLDTYIQQSCFQQFQDLGIPHHPDKLEGTSTLLTVLGIELDSLLLQARLPQDKIDRIHTLLVSPLHTEGAGVFNWKSSTCMRSRPFWSHLPPPYDQSAVSFSQRGPSYKA